MSARYGDPAMTKVEQAAANVELVERALVAPIEGHDMVSRLSDDEQWALMGEAMGESYAEDCRLAWVAFGQRDRERTGTEGLRAGWIEWMEPWAEYRSRTEEIRAVGDDRVVVVVRQSGRLHDGTVIDIRPGALVRIRDGRIYDIEFHARAEDALAAAGEDR